MPTRSHDDDRNNRRRPAIDDAGSCRHYLGDYVPQVVPLLQKHGIEVLAGHFGATALEGSADSVILLRAESEAAFRDFYDDPDYAGPKALRLSITSDQNMVVAPQFTGLSGIRPAEQHAAPPD